MNASQILFMIYFGKIRQLFLIVKVFQCVLYYRSHVSISVTDVSVMRYRIIKTLTFTKIDCLISRGQQRLRWYRLFLVNLREKKIIFFFQPILFRRIEGRLNQWIYLSFQTYHVVRNLLGIIVLAWWILLLNLSLSWFFLLFLKC